MKHMKPFHVLLIIHMLAGAAIANVGIVDSKHNLSVTGPGEIHALVEDRICVFCHTPHSASPSSPLWNRDLQPKNYTLYESSTLGASPQQPTGPTRLCLSCHDGTIALGNVLRPTEGILMNMELSAARKSYIGTDISDDHPVSFNYYEALPDPELAQTIPVGLRTYGNGNIHCTTCHDPHDNTYGKFLVMSNQYSALCTTCHANISGWSGSNHSNSSKIWNPGGLETPETVAENGCENCHTPHSAGGPKRLLHNLEEEKNCYPCHDGSVATYDVKSQFDKLSRHPVMETTIDITGNAHDPAEDILFLEGHVECVDCHNPHATNNNPASAPQASGSLSLVSGKDQNGAVVSSVVYEYEVCFKCHGDSSQTPPVVDRWINENNTILEFSPANPSYHPVVAIGQNRDMPSLPSTDEPQLTDTSLIYCTDCHDSDETYSIGGNGPRGPHGSIYRPILRQRYDTIDNQPESEIVYALCYRCHDRTKLLNDEGLYGIRGHKSHVVDQMAPCSVCHDPHGVAADGMGDHTHLINFDLGVVQPYGSNPAPFFTDLGSRAGSCTLVCHGEAHDGSAAFSYP